MRFYDTPSYSEPMVGVACVAGKPNLGLVSIAHSHAYVLCT